MVRFIFLVSVFVGTCLPSEPSFAQSVVQSAVRSFQDEASTLRDGFERDWGIAKSKAVSGVIRGYVRLVGDSCGDENQATLAAVNRPQCHIESDAIEDAVESGFFNGGAAQQIRDESCQIQRSVKMTSDDPVVVQARDAFRQDLAPKLKDLRARYKEISAIRQRMAEAGALIRRSDGAAPAGNVDLYLKVVEPLEERLAILVPQFNSLLLTTPLAHFPEGRESINGFIESNREPTDADVKSAYQKSVEHTTSDRNHLLTRREQGQPTTFNLSRNDKIFLLNHGDPLTWFRPGAQVKDVQSILCRIDRNYKTGEAVANKILTYGPYLLSGEGLLLKLRAPSTILAWAARTRLGLVSIETTNFLSWGVATVGGIDKAATQCHIMRTPVPHSGPQCLADPKSEIESLENRNCVMGLASAAGILAFSAATTKIGQAALARAAAKAEKHLPQLVQPVLKVKARLKGLSDPGSR